MIGTVCQITLTIGASLAFKPVGLLAFEQMNRNTQSLSVRRLFPVSVEDLWTAASHPGQVSHAVAMLAHFRAPRVLEPGSPIEEIHTILGWPQRYVGRITQYIPAVHWAMTSSPRGIGPFPLPHDVVFQFEPQGTNSTLTITCEFRCGGLLSVPLGPRIARWFMQRTIVRVFRAINDSIFGKRSPDSSQRGF
jgi:hypothetical protein